MFTRPRIVGAVALAIALSLPAAAGALPAAEAADPVDQEPVARTSSVVRPPSSTISATTASQLRSFAVTTDSVVASAKISYTGTPGVITVQWGDGTSSSRDPNSPLGSIQVNPDPPGTVAFQHVYAAPSNGAPFSMAVTARLGTTTVAKTVLVTPRYRVTQYTATFEPLDHCDSSAESYTEWVVEQTTNSDIPSTKTWSFDLWTNPPDLAGEGSKVLEGSLLSRELTAADDVAVFYRATEIDPLFDDELDAIAAGGIGLNPTLGSRSVAYLIGESIIGNPYDTGDCVAEIRADVDVQLLTPAVANGPVNQV